MKLKALLYALAACTLLATPRVSFADTLNLVSVGPQNAGGYYVYPYNFSVNGSKTTTSLMCMNFDREVTVGESWKVNVSGLSLLNDLTKGASALATAVDYRAEAYLFSLLTPTNAKEIQFAAWDIFDSAVTKNSGWETSDSKLVSDAKDAAKNQKLIDSGFFSGYQLYTPDMNAKSTWTAGVPQEFIGKVSPTPEPSSMLLLGTGLLASGFMLRRRMPGAQPAVAHAGSRF